MGEDGFIFSIAEPSSSKTVKPKIVGSKGPPPSSRGYPTTTIREKIAEAETPIIRRNREKRARLDGTSSTSDEEEFQPNSAKKRQPSGSVERYRRTSLLKEGTSDGDLYKLASQEVGPEERLKNVIGWILERRRKSLEKKLERGGAGEGSSQRYRRPLLVALKSTLRDLNEGVIQIDLKQKKHRGKEHHPSSSSSASISAEDKTKKRNEKNYETRREKQRLVEDLQLEKRAWKSVEDEVETFEKETQRLREEGNQEEDVQIDNVLDSIEEDNGWTKEDKRRLERVKQVLIVERQRDKEGDFTSTCGTEMDSRWKEIEFKADKLHSMTHTFSQLSTLSQRYIDTISAQGAKALKEMTESSHQPTTSRLDKVNTSSTSNDSRENEEKNLDHLLSSIRTFIDDDNDGELILDGQGDVSEGDILRAYAELS